MKTVLITGANRGLGLALSSEFQQNKYHLLLVTRTAEARTLLIKQFPQAEVLVFDVTSEDYESQLHNWLFGKRLDVVINNAGSGSPAPTLHNSNAAQLRKEFETNCVATFSTVKASLSSLKKSSNALVLNISSRRGSMSMQANKAAKGSGCSYSYRISKAAQNMLTLCLADELEEIGIKVAAIHPGRLLTKLASSDANMSPEKSAKKIVSMVINNQIECRDYLCMETGKLGW